MKNFIMRVAPMLASLALFIGISSVNAPSYYIYHQPKVPAGLEKFKK